MCYICISRSLKLTMCVTQISDELRPYFDSEIPQAVERMLADPMMDPMITFGFGQNMISDIRLKLSGVRSADQFQRVFVQPMLENIIARTSSGFSNNGADGIPAQCGHLFISNHRDIVLDGALLQLLLLHAGRPTSEITFGSNLISSQFVEDFGRSNKMYKILRDGTGRDLVRNSILLSEHIHQVVARKDSIWISQRDGRTKNGHDKTDQGLIKMLTLGNRNNPVQAIAELNIIPFAVSYEYESCDAMKAREIYMRRRGAYVKAPGEDMRSIMQGITQFKGAIHIQLCEPLSAAELAALDSSEGNDMVRGVASMIDNRIYRAYRLFATNYIAYDIKNTSNTYADFYDSDSRDRFDAYLHRQAESVTDADTDEIYDILLDIYANPVINKTLADMQ